MQSEMEKSSSLSALRQRVRDGVAESDFAGLARLVTYRGVWQAVAADPISCAYMAPVWAYGLAPAPGGLIFSVGWSGGARRCPQRIMPWAFCMRTGFACPECAPGPLPFAAGLADGAFAAGRHFLLVGVFVHCTGRRVGPRRRRGVPVQIRLGRTAGEIRVGVYL